MIFLDGLEIKILAHFYLLQSSVALPEDEIPPRQEVPCEIGL